MMSAPHMTLALLDGMIDRLSPLVVATRELGEASLCRLFLEIANPSIKWLSANLCLIDKSWDWL